jgi:hypothetical protein
MRIILDPPQFIFEILPLFFKLRIFCVSEIQLKPQHKPLEVRQSWQYLLGKFSDVSESRKERDEPRIALQRNVFLPRYDEERLKFENCKTAIVKY